MICFLSFVRGRKLRTRENKDAETYCLELDQGVQPQNSLEKFKHELTARGIHTRVRIIHNCQSGVARATLSTGSRQKLRTEKGMKFRFPTNIVSFKVARARPDFQSVRALSRLELSSLAGLRRKSRRIDYIVVVSRTFLLPYGSSL